MGKDIKIFNQTISLEGIAFVDPTIFSNRGNIRYGGIEEGAFSHEFPKVAFRALMEDGEIKLLEFERDFPYEEGKYAYRVVFHYREHAPGLIRRLLSGNPQLEEAQQEISELFHGKTMNAFFDKFEVEARQQAERLKTEVEAYRAEAAAKVAA